MDKYESATRQRLLRLMAKAERLGDQRMADNLLVEATRWLRNYPYDVAISEAREKLRIAFPPLH